MQKLIGMAFGLVMAMSTVGFAAGEGAVLTKLLKPAETMISAFNDNAVTYAMVSKDLAFSTKKTFTAKAFSNIKKQVADRFGRMKEYRFITFQRPDEMDIVTYLAGFTKEKVVSMAFVFDKTGKMLDFRFTPMQGQPAQRQQVQGQPAQRQVVQRQSLQRKPVQRTYGQGQSDRPVDVIEEE